jgi:hypothetical protein
MPSPYRREELIADTATLVYLLSGKYCNNRYQYQTSGTQIEKLNENLGKI